MPSTAELRRLFGERLQQDVALARYTSSRTGGVADHLLAVHTREALMQAVVELWRLGADFRLLGGGSNVLVADAGLRPLVLLNQARRTRFSEDESTPGVEAESGASLGAMARRAAERGLSGLEWAATVPGTVGGALVGNAGAHGGDVAGSLEAAEVLLRPSQVARWTPDRFEYGYRTSWLKTHPGQGVVLSAWFRLTRSSPQVTRARVEANVEYRQRTQPPGASWGSMFRNPPGDFAGRLVEAAGLKGTRIGNAEISRQHANFFLNRGGASATDVARLLMLARQRVQEAFGVRLELEIELIGDWDPAIQESLR